MNFATVIAVLIIATVAIWRQANPPIVKKAGQTTGKTIIESPQPSPRLVPSPSPSPQSSPPPVSSPSPPISQQDLFQFVYPDSRLIDSSKSRLTLESLADADTITSWYQRQIQNLGLSTKSFVKTKTNGQVLNKLVGAGGQLTVAVEIKQKPDDPTVVIAVSLNK